MLLLFLVAMAWFMQYKMQILLIKVLCDKLLACETIGNYTHYHSIKISKHTYITR